MNSLFFQRSLSYKAYWAFDLFASLVSCILQSRLVSLVLLLCVGSFYVRTFANALIAAAALSHSHNDICISLLI